MTYLTHESAEAFLDFPMQKPSALFSIPCPKCHGHGGWNLQVNAYSLHGKEDTPENRHRFSHFTQACGQCDGYGYVEEGETCIHEWKFSKNLGRCYNQYCCVKCNKISNIDSSD